jgi:hypothetical protein
MGSRVAVLALAPVLAVAAAHAATETPRRLITGPVLAGDGVAWSENDGAASVLRLWRPGRGTAAVFRSETTTVGRGLTGSGELLAFERSYPGCPSQPGVVCPILTDIALGPRAGPFRPILAARKCALPFSQPGLDLVSTRTTSFVAYDAVDCVRERVTTFLQTTSTPPKRAVLRSVTPREACCAGLRLAGRFVAWSSDWNERVSVVDRDSNHVVVSVRVGDGVSAKPTSFDVQADGTLAVIADGRVFWISSASPRPHVIAERAPEGSVRIARAHIAYGRAGAVVVSDLRGRGRVVARFQRPARLHRTLDFDGARLVFASDVVTRTWVDCPPQGEGRPCIRRESGTTTIWLARAPEFALGRIARFAFEGISGSSR